MVDVRCLILCSKFAKNRLSAGLRPDPLNSTQPTGGAYSALPRSPSWIMGEGRGNGRWKGRRKGKGGRAEDKERRGRKERISVSYGYWYMRNVKTKD